MEHQTKDREITSVFKEFAELHIALKKVFFSHKMIPAF